MAIKVKHEGNVASRLAGSADGGRAKRAMEAAALARPTPIQMTQGARIAAPGAHTPTAPLIHAPTGGSSAPLVSGGGGIGATYRTPTGGFTGTARNPYSTPSTLSEPKVTGNNVFQRPDAESQWNPNSLQWERQWLPGEKEAEVQQRVGDVKSAQDNANWEFRYSQQQKMEQDKIREQLAQLDYDTRFDNYEKSQLRDQLLGRFYGIQKLPFERDDAESAFKRTTYTNPEGVIFSRDGKVVYDPLERQARVDANKEAQVARIFQSLIKPYTKTTGTDEGEVYETVVRNEDEAMKIAQRLVYGESPVPSPTPAPTPAPSAPVSGAPTADPNDWKSKLGW